ncbi:MAG: rhodanese-like domain-containing protein [Bacteroidales bacterium]|nr:rhodanese-like domain-containing protein [Bacteroidales bacterium]
MKNIKFNISILALLIFLLSACTAIYEDGKELASVVKSEINEISIDTLKSMIDNGEEFLLLDIRQPAEYEAGNIPGSFSIPRGELEFFILDEYYWEEQFMYTPLKTDKIIVYCKSGARGTLATQALKKLGFENVSNLQGGWIGFAGENPTVTKQPESGGCGG